MSGGHPLAALPVLAPWGRSAVTIHQQDCLRFLEALPPESVDVIVTDPAYSGMNRHLMLGRGRIVGRYRDAGGDGAKWFTEFGDDPETFHRFLVACHRVLRPDRHVYIMFDSYSLLSLGPVVRDVFAVKNLVVWDKVDVGMGHYFRRRFEVVVFAVKGRRKLNRRNLPDVWAIKRLHRAPYPTQKPVALFQRMLEGSAHPGFIVCDPFVGAGSSAIAALRAGCAFVGADVSPRAVALAQRRCQVFLTEGIDPLEPAGTRGRCRAPRSRRRPA